MRPSLRALPFALTTALVALAACGKSAPQAPQEPPADAALDAPPRDDHEGESSVAPTRPASKSPMAIRGLRGFSRSSRFSV